MLWKEVCMKSRVILALLIGSSITLSACGQAAQGTEVAADEAVSAESVVDAAESESTAVAESDTAESSTSSKKKGTHSNKKTDSSSESSSGTLAYSLSDGESISGGTYDAENEDESAIGAGGTVSASVSGAVINKISGDATSADSSSFEGVNAAVRAYDNATVTLEDCTITAEADNATGVFAYDGGTIIISDSTVNVTGGGAGGIQVAGGGTLYADNLTVTSASKAAIRSDRGGGTMVVNGGTYTSTGTGGCPAIYSTADIQVSDATCISENSRAVIIEGKNSVTLENCTLSGNDQSTKEGSIKANVLLYQSASGDAEDGTGVFTMNGGSMKSSSGAMFYCTNTSSVISLSNAELELSDTGEFMIVSAGRWGNDGSNGGNCTLNATDQKIEGTITVDDISSLELNLEKSEYTGAINSSGQAGNVSVTLADDSTWELTGDSYISEFNGDTGNIVTNGFHVYVDGKDLS